MYKRPEKETDPKKYPGQIVNRPPSGPDTLQHNIAEWQRVQKAAAMNFKPDCGLDYHTCGGHSCNSTFHLCEKHTAHLLKNGWDIDEL
jgi:hypothetical protein